LSHPYFDDVRNLKIEQQSSEDDKEKENFGLLIDELPI